jgi:hypothetical protein
VSPILSSWRTLAKRVVKGAIMNERGCVTVSMRALERIKIIATVAEHRRSLAADAAAEKDDPRARHWPPKPRVT